VHACTCVRACRYPGVWACACSYVHTALLIQHATRMHLIVTSFVAPGLHYIFRHYLKNGAIFREKVTEYKMCVFILSTAFVYNISHSKKNLAKCRHKCRNVFVQHTRYFCWILMKFEFSRQIFEKVQNIEFHQNPSIGNRAVPCR
jgi:hypothetical protein